MEEVEDGLFPVVKLCFSPRAAARHATVTLCSDGTCRRLYPTKTSQPVSSAWTLMGNTRCSSSVFTFSTLKHTQGEKVHHRVARLQNVGWRCILQEVQRVTVCCRVSLHALCRRPLHDPSSSRRSALRRKCRGVQVSLWDQTLCLNISNHQWDPLIGQQGPRVLFVWRAFLNSRVRVKHSQLTPPGGHKEEVQLCKSGELLCSLCKQC